MVEIEQDETRYTKHGYKDRNEYLESIADNHNIDPLAVNMIADILGESEDFDGLVSELEDLEYSNFLNDFRIDDKCGDDDNEKERSEL